ncbi:DUF421 domain-containing protein [Egicoccus sp. AB-alg2]|uniref:DUF421 domain-containing protein n=1 Tax=Egicoccus sp. AB-alg2 TaxID=3242693 RepID=UPI00359E728C
MPATTAAPFAAAELGAELGAGLQQLGVVAIAAVAIYGWVILASRVLGLRSFAKMSAFDFAMTVAIGSVIAGIAIGTAPLVAGILAVTVLFGAQYLVAQLRRGTRFDRVVDNQPLLLVHEGRILDEHLARARLTRGDLFAKLRAANVLDPHAVRAVVFETTGDITVLHGSGPLDPALLEGVQGRPGDTRDA